MRSLTRLQHNCTSREFHFFGKKAHQCRVRLPFDRWRTQFDLNRATVLTYDAVALGIWNDMHSQNRHSANHIRAEGSSLDGF